MLETIINKQKEILTQTNDLVAKQATAINSHTKIVNNALDYSEKFNVSKLQEIITREVLLEKQEEFEKIRKEHLVNIEKLQQNYEDEKKQIVQKHSEILREAIKATLGVLSNMFSEPMRHFFIDLALKNNDERENIIKNCCSCLTQRFDGRRISNYAVR